MGRSHNTYSAQKEHKMCNLYTPLSHDGLVSIVYFGHNLNVTPDSMLLTKCWYFAKRAELCIKVATIGLMNGVLISHWHLWDHFQLNYWRDGNSKSIVRIFSRQQFSSPYVSFFCLTYILDTLCNGAGWTKCVISLKHLKFVWADKYHDFFHPFSSNCLMMIQNRDISYIYKYVHIYVYICIYKYTYLYIRYVHVFYHH